ncbi:RapZ C-terminal domain-containing protein (plasmid) [Streptomyces sp. HUAS TT3]|uniref:RapZ C-terminal domain-containing protein n=1 Tax=Streptomyces sp. HUAS TT3 TaxID=3447510 RepID=UPI003F65F0D3
MRPIRLTSFGYLHLPTGPGGSPVPPAADRIGDVRDRLRDPAAARDVANLADYADLPAGPSHIVIGCAGGRHRVVDRTTEGHAGRMRIPCLV